MTTLLVAIVAAPAIVATVALAPAVCVQLLLNRSFRPAALDRSGPPSASIPPKTEHRSAAPQVDFVSHYTMPLETAGH